jgi:hypothetical protein
LAAGGAAYASRHQTPARETRPFHPVIAGQLFFSRTSRPFPADQLFLNHLTSAGIATLPETTVAKAASVPEIQANQVLGAFLSTEIYT